jgi:hypothetical protein
MSVSPISTARPGPPAAAISSASGNVGIPEPQQPTGTTGTGNNGAADANVGIANLGSPTGNTGSGDQLASGNAGVLNRNSPTGNTNPGDSSPPRMVAY